jgi:arabinoxylan arabinofuranohydrolase
MQTQETFARRLKALMGGVALASAFSAQADYPIVPHRYAADPAAVEFNGRLYVYCSNDDENGTNGYLMSSITCFSTDDLKNWTDHGVVFRANSTSWASLTWAPSAISNQNRVYLYFANGAGSIGVATSSVPTGPFTDARGSSLINGSTPGASTATQWLFDPCAFIDDGGQAYLYFGGQYPTNARVIQLNANLTSVSGSASPMFATNFFEASYMHKRNGIYYYTYCNRFEFGAAIYCETNSTPTTGFVPQGTVLANPPQNVNNNNHHSIVSYLGNWYILYHSRAAALANGLSNGDAVYKRSLCIDAINYGADGSIQQVTPTTDGLAQLKNVDPYKRAEGETFAQRLGIGTEVCAEGGLNVTSVTNGTWVRIRGVDFGAGATTFYARVASAASGGNIELRLDGPNGTLAGTCSVPSTGGWQSWATVSANVSGASGVHDLYLKFTGGAGNLFNLNWWQFQFGGGAGGASPLSFEAESGTLGADWLTNIGGSPAVTNITISSSGTGNNPSNATRVASYNVTFPAAGTYQLYARLRVGPGAFDDDSLFYASSFGPKNPTLNSDWILVNGLAGVGFSNSTDVVTGGGTLGSGMWKWINLSQFTGQPGFTVSAGNLTQTFQIGARENGLDLDKLAFGLAGYTFTVADLDTGSVGSAPAPTVTLNPASQYQTIEGLGGAICFYNGWFTAHPYKEEIYSNAFAGLNLSMLRLGNWFRYQGTTNFDTDAREFVAKARNYLGRPVPVYMSSWAPPAFLKSNGQVGNGGTLITNADGSFAYAQFAQYWYDALLAYGSNGVSPTWISIQNEPDFEASYDSCVFRPNEGVVNGTNYASYAKALDAVFNKLTNLPTPPKFLAPEVVHISWNTLQNYAATMNPNSFYGVAHHLYGDGNNASGDSFLPALRAATNVFPNKPRFMTEYGDVFDMIECANLIHNSLVVESVSGYNHWNLLWPGTSGGLIQIENPWNQSSWTNAPAGTPTQSRGWWYSPSYWSMKHFSYYVQPGFKRVSATVNDNNVRGSAYRSPDGLRLVLVLINTNAATSAALDLNAMDFPFVESCVYQTVGTNNYFKPLGQAGSQLTLPPRSLTTVVLEKFVTVGPASNPSPAQNETGVGYSAVLSWSPGSNAVTHAVYLGTSSNAVALATPASPEFKGNVSTNSLATTLSGGATYFWRVTEIAGANTNAGGVWTFSTAPLPALAHRYNFSESGGASTADSVGGPAWNGTLFNGGTLSGGQLTFASVSSQHARLPAGIVSTFSNFTIEAWVKLNSATNWSRIFDFGHNTAAYMFLTPQNGSNTRLRFAITTNGPGGEQQLTGPVALSVGPWHHVAVTLNGNVGTLYLNGAPAATNGAMNLRPATLGTTPNNYLGRSQWPDPYFNGSLDEFRIYSVALSASEIAATYALGPNDLLSTNTPALGVSVTPPNLTLTWPLASAGFTVQSRTNLTQGNWVNVPSPAPQIVNGQWQVTLPPPADSEAQFYRLMK